MTSLQRFLDFVKQHNLFQPEDKVLLAVSGGRDSVLMAHLFKQAGFKFSIAHCNFRLRADESDADEKFCSELAGRLNVPFHSAAFDTKKTAGANKISIQMAARDLRYSWLEEIRSNFNYSYISLAHHQNDEIETILLNLVRGTGIAGLHGILPKRNHLIRPLLCFSREEIDQIVLQGKLEYREDSSNYSVKYARNKIRREIIPLLKELNPSLEATFRSNRKRFAELEVLLHERLAELKMKLFTESPEGSFEIELARLKALQPLDTLLYGLFSPFGFTEPVLSDLVRSWDGSPGKRFSSLTHEILLDRDKVILARMNKEHNQSLDITLDDKQVNWGAHRFQISTSSRNTYQLRKTNTTAQLDFSRLQFPLILRSWKDGDSFMPMGMNGKKKLSDLFVSEKIPLHKKQDIPVLVNGNGDILWIGGLRTDKRYIIGPNTEKVFIFEQFI